MAARVVHVFLMRASREVGIDVIHLLVSYWGAQLAIEEGETALQNALVFDKGQQALVDLLDATHSLVLRQTLFGQQDLYLD